MAKRVIQQIIFRATEAVPALRMTLPQVWWDLSLKEQGALFEPWFRKIVVELQSEFRRSGTLGTFVIARSFNEGCYERGILVEEIPEAPDAEDVVAEWMGRNGVFDYLLFSSETAIGERPEIDAIMSKNKMFYVTYCSGQVSVSILTDGNTTIPVERLISRKAAA